MRNLREIYRLRFEARLSQRKIARCIKASTTTVGEYLKRFEGAGLTWPLPEEMTDAELEAELFPSVASAAMKRPVPNWANVQTEVKSHKGVTLQLLWKEYKERHPDDGYCLSHYCALYREWRGQVDVTMRQDHIGGEKLFVDYAGVTVPITNPSTGEIRPAQIFVATLGASNYTYAEATWTQQLRDWIEAHCRAFALLRRRQCSRDPRQYQDRRHEGVLLRAGAEPDLPGHGRPLRRRHRAGPRATRPGWS